MKHKTNSERVLRVFVGQVTKLALVSNFLKVHICIRYSRYLKVNHEIIHVKHCNHISFHHNRKITFEGLMRKF